MSTSRPSVSALPRPARDAVLAWYRPDRRGLAFRRTSDPYAVLVAETMAQQTQAARAAAYWERFVATFLTVDALAAASPAEVLRAWQGLGYDRRALALWRAARMIVAEHGGRVPDSIDALEALPGVGPYTARAVAAIAFGRPVAPVDVNVRRVIGRLVAGGPDALSRPDLQAIADAVVPADRPGEWTHAVMDLGALMCRPRAPRCEDCPVRAWCRYAADHARDRGLAATSARAPRSVPAIPFPATTRWLRGRILDRLRATPDGAWSLLDEPIGEHDVSRVAAAARAMAADGVVELDESVTGAPRARLPLA
jgi:A/G-specific adenine glycosylase